MSEMVAEEQTPESVYASHLAEVNEVSSVIATQDIKNSQGQIVVPKGRAICKNTYSKIVKFKLLKPIEDSVAIENELNAAKLSEKISEYMQADQGLAQLYEEFNDDAIITTGCESVCSYQLLRQKITVLQLRLNHIFEQALFCAWMGAILLRRANASRPEITDYFAAALCHDLGMLHIHPDVLEKTGQYTHDEWRQMQAHPVISYNILQSVPKITKEICQSVLQHHEQLDGTGYPRGLKSHQICDSARLLNLLDTVHALYLKNFKNTDYGLREVIPILQMNVHGRYGALANSLIMLFKVLPESQSCSVPQRLIPDFVEEMKHRKDYISDSIELANETNQKLGFTHNEEAILAVQNSIIHINVSMLQSGIINDAYIRWLDQVIEENLVFAYKEIEGVYIMMSEIIYQLDKLKRQIRDALDNCTAVELTRYLREQLGKLEKINLKPTSDALKSVWAANVV